MLHITVATYILTCSMNFSFLIKKKKEEKLQEVIMKEFDC